MTAVRARRAEAPAPVGWWGPAVQSVASALDPSKYDVEIAHLGNNKALLKEAEAAGVKSVPALVMQGAGFHINYGAAIEALK